MIESLIGILAASAVALIAMALWQSLRRQQQRNRDYLDPLPWPLRCLWPVVHLVQHLLEPLLTESRVCELQQQITRSGWRHKLHAEELIALQVTLALLLGSGSYGLTSALDASFGVEAAVLMGLLGLSLPRIKLRDARRLRERQIRRDLPVFLDFLTMAVDAGLSLGGGLQQAVQYGPSGALRQEFARVIRDIRTGQSRQDALRALGIRLDIREVTLLISALLQAEQTGASLAQTLRIQAEQRRTERFLQAEKMAMQAPVKLIFPLIVCVFPVTFLMLGFPIVMKFIHEI